MIASKTMAMAVNRLPFTSVWHNYLSLVAIFGIETFLKSSTDKVPKIVKHSSS